MHSTSQLGLPLVMPAQAQKHVTVNEAFVRLDAVVQLRFARSTLRSPSSSSVDGQCFLIPSDATAEWEGLAGQIAARSNGGWVYLVPSAGWTGWDAETATRLIYDGVVWSPEPQAASKGGAVTLAEALEFDHEITAGQSNLTSFVIPANSQVLAVTGRVKTGIIGLGLSGWRLGVEGADDRYGTNIGLSFNSYVLGVSGYPVTYYEPTRLIITSEGGDFESGAIRFCAHLVAVRPPAPF